MTNGSTKGKYKHPPIKEAVIDIQFRPGVELSYDLLIEFAQEEEMRAEFPLLERRVAGSIQLPTDIATDKTGFEGRYVGVLLKRQDQSRAVQVRETGFTFNLLNAYSSWEEFREEARIIWSRFANFLRKKDKDVEIQRLGLRYINVLRLPLREDFTFQQYLNWIPPVPDGAGNSFYDFFQRIHVSGRTDNEHVIIIEKLEGQVEEDKLPVILDIDIFRMAISRIDFATIWTELDEMRLLKNEVFENCLSEATRQLFD
jgi:uncharacterized protein (TIGR04255 family)